jgi:hypothetical protein
MYMGVINTARGSSLRDRDKIMRKALKRGMRKKREEKNTIPFLPITGPITVMDSMNPTKRMAAKLLRTKQRNGRTMMLSLQCPVCRAKMFWDERWRAFICRSSYHPNRRGIYELVSQ